MADQSEDNITTADALAVLVSDLGIESLRLRQGRPTGQRIDMLPKRQREEVRAIQAKLREWAVAFQEARRS